MPIFFTGAKTWPQVASFFAILVFITAPAFAPRFHYLIQGGCGVIVLLALLFWNSRPRRRRTDPK